MLKLDDKGKVIKEGVSRVLLDWIGDVEGQGGTKSLFVLDKNDKGAAATKGELDRLKKATLAHPDYRTTAEREAVLQDISRATGFYKSCSADQK